MPSSGRFKELAARLLAPDQRPYVLLSVFLALLALFLSFLRSTPEGQRWLAEWQAKRLEALTRQRFQEAFSHDPPIGFPLKRLGISVASENFSSSRPVLVVVFGGCEGCGEGAVREWASTLSWRTWRKEVTAVLVFQERAEKVREAARQGGWKVKVVADESGQIARALNAFFVPRAYGFVDGKLVWLEREPKRSVVGTLESFLKAVKGEEAERKVMEAWVQEMREKAWGKEMAGLAKGGDGDEGMLSRAFGIDLDRVAFGHRDYRRVGRNNLVRLCPRSRESSCGSLYEQSQTGSFGIGNISARLRWGGGRSRKTSRILGIRLTLKSKSFETLFKNINNDILSIDISVRRKEQGFMDDGLYVGSMEGKGTGC